MVVSGFYDCVAALLKYCSYQKNLSDIALLKPSPKRDLMLKSVMLQRATAF